MLVIFYTLFCCLPAFATLGEILVDTPIHSTDAKSNGRIISYSGYSVSENLEPSGTTVREYILPNGIVFAVSWQGPSMPNLRQLLGRYAGHYINAANTPHAGRRAIVIQSDQFVLRSDGHMRSFAGSAYVPALLPQGITANDIH